MSRKHNNIDWGTIAMIASVLLMTVSWFMVGISIGTNNGIEKANTIIKEYREREQGKDLLERCKANGLENCHIEFGYTDKVITSIEVIGERR